MTPAQGERVSETKLVVDAVCQNCDGFGWMEGTAMNACPNCLGSGVDRMAQRSNAEAQAPTRQPQGEMMNRRKAISALMSLPATAVITQAKVEAEDTIVVECQEHLSSEMAGRIKTAMEGVWPGRKVAVLDNGMKLKIVRQA